MIVGELDWLDMSVLEATHRKTKGLALPGEQVAAVCCTEPCCSCSTHITEEKDGICCTAP